MASRRVLPCHIHFSSLKGTNFRIAQDRGTGVGKITIPTNQLISGLVLGHTLGMVSTEWFPLTKTSQFGSNIYPSTVHNIWQILQILDGASAVCQDPDNVLIRVESMIGNTTDGNGFRSKDKTVVRIPDTNFNITPCSTLVQTATVSVNNPKSIKVSDYVRNRDFAKHINQYFS
ncbi:hypothetical protein TNCV_2354321 [Trichonephila clavipes]|nr:hypothetical protein TNCV_2354321 [Trichonephila clavipes]